MKLQRGYSLVELMIALALGSIITLGVVQLFVENSATHRVLVGQSRMQESARFSLEFIAREVRQAGFRGCYSSDEEFHTTIAPESNLPYEFDLRFGIEGYEATGDNVWSPALTKLPNTAADLPMANAANTVFKTTYGFGTGSGIDLTEVISGTDVITLRHLDQSELRLGAYAGAAPAGDLSDSSLPLIVRVPAAWAGFDEDHIVMVSDCEKATMFRVTSANPWGRNTSKSPKAAPSAQDLTIGHTLVHTDTTRNSFAKLARIKTFETDASVSAIESHTFFIAEGTGVNNQGDQPKSLWRKSGLNKPIELVEGVENLQLLYGVDLNEDLTPDQYLQGNLINNWRAVITVRITVVVTSVDNVGSSADDGLLRRTFSQTVQLRNHG